MPRLPPLGLRRRSTCKGRVMSLIEVDSVSKAFWIPNVRRETVREHASPRSSRVDFSELQVLEAGQLALAQGEALGIMGRNGSGKSTLLEDPVRIYPPDRGRVVDPRADHADPRAWRRLESRARCRGQCLLIGSVMGLSLARTSQRMDEILAFAELERFANLKLKHYSSGMSARLGYAVAFKAVREVLVLDEFLRLATPDSSSDAKNGTGSCARGCTRSSSVTTLASLDVLRPRPAARERPFRHGG